AGQAGAAGQGWYSFDLGSWHIISLNAECPTDAAGNCVPGSSFFAEETAWLGQDLASDHAQCTLAYWHQPLFTAVDPAPSSQGAETRAWWNLLYKHGADLVLNGHDHVYARWAPMTPSGAVDTRRGIRQFTVGTGGEDHDTLASPLPSTVQAATDSEFGVLKLDLGQGRYGWNFLPATVPGQANTFTDSGTGSCHGPSQA
ncbi:MAG: metallophosphoesterase, partial [Candidatus Dormibacteraeota bacterium]|nr:metallophosphoesterase [Candidatus Dormibacteraeota bacterium]